MADEHANITLTLTDEMSDKLRDINQQVDTLRNRFENLGASSNQAFNQAHQAATRIPEKLSDIEKLIQKTFGRDVRHQLEEFSRSMGNIAGQTLGMSSAVGTASATVTRLAFAIGGAVSVTTAWVTALIAGGVAVYKISEAINRAHQESLNFQKQIGASETQIRSWTIAAESLGMSTEEARGSMQRLTSQVQDLVRGTYAPLARELMSFGEKGVAAWDAVRTAQEQGQDSLEQTAVLLRHVSTWSEAAQRSFAQYSGMNIRQQQLLIDRLREVQAIVDSPRARAAYAYQEEQSGKVAMNWFKIKLELERLRPLWDYVKGGFFEVVNVLAVALLNTLKAINFVVDLVALAFGKVKDVVNWLIEHTPTWLKYLFMFNPAVLAYRLGRKLTEETPEEKEQRERQDRPVGSRPAPPMTPLPGGIPRSTGPAAPPMTPLYFAGSGGAGQFRPDLGWAGGLHGEESRNIEDRRNLVIGERDQTSYLREIRDVLVWMQMQMVGPEDQGKGTPQRFTGGGGFGRGGGLWGGGAGGLGAGGGVLGGRGGGGTTGLGSGSAPYAPTQQARIGMPGGEFDRPTLSGGLPEGGRGAAPPPLWLSPEGADRWKDQLGGGSQGVTSGGVGAGGTSTPIAAERARVMAQLNEPATRQLAAWMLGQEHGASLETRSDVLESLVNRAVVTGKHPRDLLLGGFYGPINRYRNKHGGQLPSSDARGLELFDQAARDVGAGRNVLGGRTDQGMINEVKRQGRMESRGEYYGWMGLKGEQQTAAARGGPSAMPTRVAGPGQPPGLPPSVGASPDQRGRPDYYGGTVSVDGQTFHYGTGGGRTPSMPFGTFNINPAWTGEGVLGDVGKSIGSIATVGGRGGEIWDPREGRTRLGIQIHAANSDDLDRLYSAGCFAVAKSEWPRFKAALMKKVQRDGPLAVTVLPNGQAVVHARGAAPENATQYAAKAVRTEKITSGATAGPPPGGGPSMTLPGAGATAPATGRFTPGPTGDVSPHTAPPPTPPSATRDTRTDLQVLEAAERYYGITPPGGGGRSRPVSLPRGQQGAAPVPMTITGTSFMGEQQRAQQAREADAATERRHALGIYTTEELRNMTPEQWERVAPKLGRSTSGRADPVGTDEQWVHSAGTFSSVGHIGRMARLTRLGRLGISTARGMQQETGHMAGSTARDQDKDTHAAHDNDEARSNRMVTGRQWAMHRGQAQPVADRTAIDRSIAGQQNAGRIGKGRLDVHFWNAPRGMRAKGSGTDALEEMNIKQTPHMARSPGTQAPPGTAKKDYADEE